jgi:zinc-ribbon domain
MFCNQCGTRLQPGSNTCPRCGKVATLPDADSPQSRLERHVRTLGILWIIAGALFLIPSLGLMAIGSLVHIALPGPEAFARTLGPMVLYVLGSTFLILAAGGICVGWGLMQRQSWARIAAIILGILALFHPPIGTALGIYTLWVLLAQESGSEYERMARAA